MFEKLILVEMLIIASQGPILLGRFCYSRILRYQIGGNCTQESTFRIKARFTQKGLLKTVAKDR